MKKVIRISVVVVILAAMIVGYYYYLSNRNATQDKDTKKDVATEYTALISRDLDKNYPKTPRATVKLYNRIVTEYYASSHNDEEIEGLASQAYKLLDSDLQDKNPKEQFMKSVKADVQDWKNRKASIRESKVCSSNDVTYSVVEGSDCAYVYSYYFVKENGNFSRTYQEFCLRKDKSGNWKILTWRVIDEADGGSYQYS